MFIQVALPSKSAYSTMASFVSVLVVLAKEKLFLFLAGLSKQHFETRDQAVL